MIHQVLEVRNKIMFHQAAKITGTQTIDADLDHVIGIFTLDGIYA